MPNLWDSLKKSHQEFYEITQSAYQTAKLGKLLNLFDKGQGVQYRKMNLENIDIDLSKECIESDEEDQRKDRKEEVQEHLPIGISNEKEECKSIKEKNKIRWNNNQKKIGHLTF